ncbi:MAG: ABC transporter permease [Gemmataceae bacterium]
MSFFAIFQIALCRLREFCREPAALFWVYGFPQVILLALGFAFTDRAPDQLHVDLVTLRLSETQTDSIQSLLEQEQRLIVKSGTKQTSLERLQKVKISAVIVAVPSKNTTLPPKYTIHYDPDRIDSSQAQVIAEGALLRAYNSSVTITSQEERQRGGRYIDFLVPGLLAVGVMGGSLVAIGYTLVEMRMRKLLRVYLATPLRKDELFLGLMLGRLGFLLPEVFSVVVVSWVVFGVTVAGNFLLLLITLFVGAVAFMGIGLFFGARGKSLEAISGWVSLLMLVQWVFCGVFFSRAVYPPEWQAWLQWIPLSALVDATRGVMQDAAGWSEIFDELVVLTIWSVVSFLVAIWRFRVD